MRILFDGTAPPAQRAAFEADPLQAALEAVWAAVTTDAERRAEIVADLRRTFRLPGPG